MTAPELRKTTTSSFLILSVTLGTAKVVSSCGAAGDGCVHSVHRSDRTEAQNEGMRGKRQEWITVSLNDQKVSDDLTHGTKHLG